ncbi:Alpha/Beta hydrolase protein [Flagelloscypha sp. PMI_526]|nr:Alpha/Beta hydrolase protein [Flagelloscypha sp. PMI_526]
MSTRLLRRILLLSIPVLSVFSLPSSYPNTDGQPTGDYSPAWQPYYKVTAKLPGISFALPTSYAGNIRVDREGHPNNTLFFWGFEKKTGSFANTNSNEPWGIWLNGGPGSSSMIGLFKEIGPLTVNPNDNSMSPNKYAWTKIADYFFIDSPVGVGFSTADETGYVSSEDQIGSDFFGFLANLVKVFPGLAKRPLIISGESYAGMYIPYILKTYLALPNPPVKLSKIVIGDGTINTDVVFELVSSLNIIKTFPQIIGYDTEVFEYFRQQNDICNYTLDIQYPQPEPLPYIPLVLSPIRDIPFAMAEQRRMGKNVMMEVRRRFSSLDEPVKREKIEARRLEGGLHRRDLSLRPSDGSLDLWYGCDLLDEFIDYAVNYTYPWNVTDNYMDYYDIPDVLEYPNPWQDWNFEDILNNPAWRAALHAPTCKDWVQSFEYTFGELGYTDPSPDPMTFLSDMTQSAYERNIGIVYYSANNDGLIAHTGTEVTIQNTTWGGIRGFTRKPATAFIDDSGKFAGIIHQERGVTYALFDDASHLVPMSKPAAAFTFSREFVFGSNPLGLVKASGSVVGGEDPNLAKAILRAKPDLYLGAGRTTTSTYVFPSATIAAWDAYIATATAV